MIEALIGISMGIALARLSYSLRVLIERQTGPLSLGGGYRDPYRPPRNSRPHQIDVFRVRSTRGVPHQGEHSHAARVLRILDLSDRAPGRPAHPRRWQDVAGRIQVHRARRGVD